MKSVPLRLALLTALGLFVLPAAAQNTKVTYQGRLTAQGTNFTGLGQFKFALVTSTNSARPAVAVAANPSGGFVTIINVLDGGSGYTTSPVVTISGGGGSGATATANVSGGVVTSITVTNPGSGYAATPSVTITAPPETPVYETHWSHDFSSSAGSEPASWVTVPVTNGLFAAVLGDVSLPNMVALDAPVFTVPDLQLRIWFGDGSGNFSVLHPPQKLSSAPYAAQAALAGTAERVSSSSGQPLQLAVGNYPVLRVDLAYDLADGGFSVNSTGGSSANSILPGVRGGFIGGGGNPQYANQVTANYGAVLGGFGNLAGGVNSTAFGNQSRALGPNSTAFGSGCVASNDYAVAMGGATVAGGYASTAMGESTIASGYLSTAMGNQTEASGYLSLAMGGNSKAQGSFSTASGRRARALHDGSFVWSDQQDADFASTSTNQFNIRASGGARFETGGAGLTVDGQKVLTSVGTNQSFVVEVNGIDALRIPNIGANPLSFGSPSVIFGWPENSIPNGSGGVFISGGMSGLPNTVSGPFSSIVGGVGNQIVAALYASILGGFNNFIDGNSAFSTIAGGYSNRIGGTCDSAVIGGGRENAIVGLGLTAVIAGGTRNVIGGGSTAAVIGGGTENSVQTAAAWATIPGGFRNTAAFRAFAAGSQAKALHTGSFVWSDNQGTDFASTTTNQFNVRASGGVRLNNDTSLNFGNQTRQMINLWDTGYGIGVQTDAQYFRSFSEFIWYRGGSHSDSLGDAGSGGSQLMRLGSTGNLVIAGTLSQSSDRNVKEDFAAVDAQEVLAKVAALPIQSWSYTNQPGVKHVGPVAQDFHAAFGLNGRDDKHIATVDADGVALAAIQGLNRKLTEELQRRDAENVELKRRLERLEARMSGQTTSGSN